ncbi:MAG TPA: universal stress protein [Chloroflexi bacterium]|nr:universal stress protein [Chloroflexota bacterium]
MYQKILVPLDGSALAECVLPHVKAIAKGCSPTEIVLLRVVEHIPIWAAAGIDYTAAENADAREAESYLAKIQAQLSSEGFNAKSEILRGQHKAAEAISEFTQHNAVDLLAIATHGRSGISRWVFGSVADKLLRCSPIPVLLIRPRGYESGI